MVRNRASCTHRSRWLRRSTLGALPLLSLGCLQFGPAITVSRTPAPIVRGAMPEATEPAGPQQAIAPTKVLPISLDTVLRLVEAQNAQIAVGRSRVEEAFAEKDVADANWLPKIYLGSAWYRHEGGIQNPDGTFVHSSFGALFGGLELNSRYDIREITFQRVDAERKLWQQKGELSRLTSEHILEATQTYIDLLAARTGQAIVLDMINDLKQLAERSERMMSEVPRFRAEYYRLQAEITGRKQALRKLQEQAAATSAKLAYLLGIDPCIELIPVDQRLVPLELVNANVPCCDLVTQALGQGPGVREMQGLLALIHENMAKSQGMARWMPILETRMAEGAFGAGQGAGSTWDNRWDLGLQARWNLTEFLTARDRRRATEARMQQAHLAYEDLKGKLSAGVAEARETIIGEADQIRLGMQQIDEARKGFNQSLEQAKNDPLTPATEALLGLQGVGQARSGFLGAIRAYNRAQLQLLVLLGQAGNACPRPVENEARLPIAAGNGQ